MTTVCSILITIIKLEGPFPRKHTEALSQSLSFSLTHKLNEIKISDFRKKNSINLKGDTKQ